VAIEDAISKMPEQSGGSFTILTTVNSMQSIFLKIYDTIWKIQKLLNDLESYLLLCHPKTDIVRLTFSILYNIVYYA